MNVYACADLHGRYDLYEQIKNFLKPDDTVYFLGDACDRGPDSWKLVKAIYFDPQFIYLKGNHEDMFVNAAAQINHYGNYDYDYMLSVQNGGEQNIADWEKEPDRGTWISRINCLPTHAEYLNENGCNILMSHAGYFPQWDSDEERLIIPKDEMLLWDRNHWKIRRKWDIINFPNDIILHGHTPIPILRYERGGRYTEEVDNLGAYWYDGDRKVCIDNASPWLGVACLFDLNTFDEHMFIGKPHEGE